jgi:hypothetical protein
MKKTTTVQQYTIQEYQIIYQNIYNKFEIVHNVGGVGHVVDSVDTIEQARPILYSLQGAVK